MSNHQEMFTFVRLSFLYSIAIGKRKKDHWENSRKFTSVKRNVRSTSKIGIRTIRALFLQLLFPFSSRNFVYLLLLDNFVNLFTLIEKIS